MKKGLSLCAFDTNLPDREILERVRERGLSHIDLNGYSSRELDAMSAKRLVTAVASWLDACVGGDAGSPRIHLTYSR